MHFLLLGRGAGSTIEREFLLLLEERELGICGRVRSTNARRARVSVSGRVRFIPPRTMRGSIRRAGPSSSATF